MVRLNVDNVRNRVDELNSFRGFLPFQFDAYVDLTNREEFLKRNGLWDNAHKKDLEVMKGIRDNKPNDDVYLEGVLKEWVMDNPKFKDLVIFD